MGDRANLSEVRLRIAAINERLDVKRLTYEVTRPGELVIHFGLGRCRAFPGGPEEASVWLDGFQCMFESQATPCPEARS